MFKQCSDWIIKPEPPPLQILSNPSKANHNYHTTGAGLGRGGRKEVCQGRGGCKGGSGGAQEGLKGPQEEVGRGWLGDGGMESGSGPREIGTGKGNVREELYIV